MGERVWVQSPQPLEANWDLEAEPPELANFYKFFQKIKEFLSIFSFTFLLEIIILNTTKYVGVPLKPA